MFLQPLKNNISIMFVQPKNKTMDTSWVPPGSTYHGGRARDDEVPIHYGAGEEPATIGPVRRTRMARRMLEKLG